MPVGINLLWGRPGTRVLSLQRGAAGCPMGHSPRPPSNRTGPQAPAEPNTEGLRTGAQLEPAALGSTRSGLWPREMASEPRHGGPFPSTPTRWVNCLPKDGSTQNLGAWPHLDQASSQVQSRLLRRDHPGSGRNRSLHKEPVLPPWWSRPWPPEPRDRKGLRLKVSTHSPS